ncbi:MAG: HAMP domain-containing sensor histidine kinase [Candidatus Aminicenantes bacterium]
MGGRQVTIKAANKNQWVEISVTDTGTGMPKDVKNNLFKIDRTVSTPGTEGEKGTGLGLIICKEFIQKHGGQIRVNTKLNQGTTFSFTLPVSIQEAVRE